MSAGSDDRFATTRWTRVLAARGNSTLAGDALAALCEAYYAPVHAFLRATLRDEERARDLTQEFFARVLRGGAFDHAAPARGRFRSFLLGAVKHFLADMRDREHAVKRGGGAELIPIVPATDTSPGFEPSVPDQTSNDSLFDREWAITLLDRALGTIEREWNDAEKSDQFVLLKPWLTGAGTTPAAEVAARVGLNENALSVAIHRLRKRFREIVKVEIAQTVTGADEQRAELQHLIATLAAHPPE
jgi:RNA polymerase sigma-70 factor (ECF subfamily)